MVSLPRFFVKRLVGHLERWVDDDPDALVFTSSTGRPLWNSNFRRRVWRPALRDAGLPDDLRIHELRHTAASLLIAQGAHPKAIQEHLGHSSITVTMDRYGHLFPSEHEELAGRLDASREAVLERRAERRAASPRPGGGPRVVPINRRA